MSAYDLTDLTRLHIYAAEAEAVTRGDRPALRLVNGLVIFPDLDLIDSTFEVSIAAEGSAYPGIAFRIADRANYELGYTQPHTSGQWDAIQYDPVFHGSNTWQLYHGPTFQKRATVPTGVWFSLRVDVQGSRAAFTVDGQPPLIVDPLAHTPRSGPVGLWTYLPAFFSDFRVGPCEAFPAGAAEPADPPAGAMEAWFLEGFGRVACEPHGILNLNRYVPLALGEAHLTRRFEMLGEDDVEIMFGFSDDLTLSVDDQVMFQGQWTFSGMQDYAGRGYVEPDAHSLHPTLPPGLHTLSAVLKTTEGFGWGLSLSLRSDHVRLLPVE
jgi:hypothetical protein